MKNFKRYFRFCLEPGAKHQTFITKGSYLNLMRACTSLFFRNNGSNKLKQSPVKSFHCFTCIYYQRTKPENARELNVKISPGRGVNSMA